MKNVSLLKILQNHTKNQQFKKKKLKIIKSMPEVNVLNPCKIYFSNKSAWEVEKYRNLEIMKK